MIHQLETDRSILEQPAIEMRDRLWERLDKQCSPERLPRPENLPDLHRSDMPVLIHLAKSCAVDFVDHVFGEIKKRIEDGARNDKLLFTLTMSDGAAGPLERVETLIEADRNASDWLTSPISSLQNDVFPPDIRPQAVRNFLQSNDYYQMMRQKITAVAFDSAHLVFNRVYQRLEELHRELTQLGDLSERGVDLDVSVFSTVLNQLHEVS